jgi:hypothetical protein
MKLWRRMVSLGSCFSPLPHLRISGATFLRASSGETQPVGAAVMLSGPTLRDHTIAPTKSQESHNSSLGRLSTGDEGSTSTDTSTVRQTPSSSGGRDGGKTGEKGKENDRVLKRAHFILPEIAVVYPISSLAPPSTPQLRDEKRAIEERERERRRRVVRANSSNSRNLVRSPSIGSVGASPTAVNVGGGGGGGSSASGREDTVSARTTSSGAKEKEKEGGEESEWWAMDKVESFYRECCEGCQEPPDMGIMAAFKVRFCACLHIFRFFFFLSSMIIETSPFSLLLLPVTIRYRANKIPSTEHTPNPPTRRRLLRRPAHLHERVHPRGRLQHRVGAEEGGVSGV